MVRRRFLVDVDKSMLLQSALVIRPVMASKASLEVELLIFRVKVSLQICGLG